ncbi:hypothetical protein [Acrocarpospora sp. B8E8]|uniref:hypothetical protein n=1 Tax=Acrocarpospora sp. B8E8 TaxID=3153572 RepID=UPI00325D87F9
MNEFGPGIEKQDLIDALIKSGHPFQATVADKIRTAFEELGQSLGSDYSYIQEEWVYPDKDTGNLRALDALAEAFLWKFDETGRQPRIRPVLNLLVECKQSDLPYIFFTRPNTQPLQDYPWVSGFPHDRISLATNNERSTYSFNTLQALALPFHQFNTNCPVAISLSKLRRKGKDFEVTGEDTYKDLTLPLIKAAQYLQSQTQTKGRYYSDGRLIVAAAILRAPLIAVDNDNITSLRTLPWVRVLRHEPIQSELEYRSPLAYDVVREDFLPEYLQQLATFATDFSNAVIRSQSVLQSGIGFSVGLGTENPFPTELLPVSNASRTKKATMRMEDLLRKVLRRS